MKSIQILLHEASDGEDSYAIRLSGDSPDRWRALKGFGNDFREIWRLEVQSAAPPELADVDWDAVLDRAIEASNLSDPVLANFDWPLQNLA